MAKFGIENGSVDNRAFGSATGFCKKFMDWVVKTPSNHGPQWYIYDDQSALITDPYIVVTNQASPTVNSKAVFVKLIAISASEAVHFFSYIGWNTSTHTGIGIIAANVITTQSGSFSYYFRGGDDFLMVIARIGSNATHARLSRFNGLWDGSSKMLEPESTSGVLTNPAFFETDPGGRLSGYHLMTGYTANLDGAGKLYMSITHSGANYQVNFFKDSARTQLIGHTTGSGSAAGLKTITPDNSSGLGGTINADITMADAADMDCRFNRVDLGSGQGSAFRTGKWYFLIDFTGSVQRIRYVKVVSKSGDQLVLDSLGALDFGAGAYISPYPHRWVQAGSVAVSFWNSPGLPYAGVQGSEAGGFSLTTNAAIIDSMVNAISLMAPDDEGDFACQKPWWGDSAGSPNRRIYGEEINVILTSQNGLNPFTDRRVISGVPYLFFGTISTGQAVCVLDVESLS